MSVPRLSSVRMVDEDDVSVSALPAGQCDLAAARRHDGRSRRYAQVVTVMIGAGSSLGCASRPESGSNVSSRYRPDIGRRHDRASLHDPGDSFHHGLLFDDIRGEPAAIPVTDAGDDLAVPRDCFLNDLCPVRKPGVVILVDRGGRVILFVILLHDIVNRELRAGHPHGDPVTRTDHCILICQQWIDLDQLCHVQAISQGYTRKRIADRHFVDRVRRHISCHVRNGILQRHDLIGRHVGLDSFNILMECDVLESQVVILKFHPHRRRHRIKEIGKPCLDSCERQDIVLLLRFLFVLRGGDDLIREHADLPARVRDQVDDVLAVRIIGLQHPPQQFLDVLLRAEVDGIASEFYGIASLKAALFMGGEVLDHVLDDHFFVCGLSPEDFFSLYLHLRVDKEHLRAGGSDPAPCRPQVLPGQLFLVYHSHFIPVQEYVEHIVAVGSKRNIAGQQKKAQHHHAERYGEKIQFQLPKKTRHISLIP